MKTFPIIAFLLLTSCDYVPKLNSNEPMSVARDFWVFALSADKTNATDFMVEKDVSAIQHLHNGYAELGTMTLQHGVYFIRTILHLEQNEQTYTLPILTIIEPVAGQWKVNYLSTENSVIDAVLERSLDLFTTHMKNANRFFPASNANDKPAALSNAKDRLDAFKQAMLLAYASAYDNPAQ